MSKSFPEPAVTRHALVLTSGFVWLLAGVILTLRGLDWIITNSDQEILLILAATTVGILKSYFIFFKIIKKNIRRIKELAPHKDKICIFAFQANMSYLLVLVMISAGIALRLSPMPRLYLGLIYTAIGVALGLSGIKYILASRQL